MAPYGRQTATYKEALTKQKKRKLAIREIRLPFAFIRLRMASLGPDINAIRDSKMDQSYYVEDWLDPACQLCAQ